MRLSHRAPATQPQAGYLLILVLIFGAIFLVLVSAFIGSVVLQSQVVDVRFQQQQATEIAEAGLNHYRWHLTHFPGDTSLDGVTTVYVDPEAGPLGEYTYDVSATSYCGAVSALAVEANAFTYANADADATVSATYRKPTVAEYSFITNAATWYGASRVIAGPVHGNQGVKMDGAHNSTVTSGQETWNCTSVFGCSPTEFGVPGVYTKTTNATPGLFQFPAPPIDFEGITVDLASMKASAQTDGIYYGPTSGFGYWLQFQADNTVDVYRVTGTATYWAYSSYEGWHTNERNVITDSQFVATRSIDPTCPVLYFEDKVWLQGQIAGKVTLAAANLDSGTPTNMVLHNDVTYVPGVGAGLLAIAEDDFDIGVTVPDSLTANGLFVAQNGRFGRNHYDSDFLVTTLDPYVTRSTLTRLGSVVSRGRVGTAWVSGTTHVSGFASRVTTFDRAQVDDPPPLTPTTNDVYELRNWRLEN